VIFSPHLSAVPTVKPQNSIWSRSTKEECPVKESRGIPEQRAVEVTETVVFGFVSFVLKEPDHSSLSFFGHVQNALLFQGNLKRVVYFTMVEKHQGGNNRP